MFGGARTFLALIGGSVLMAAIAAPPAPGSGRPPKKIEYGRDVRPILSQRCFKCHGPDGAVAQATGLRMDKAEDLLRDRGGYAVVVPGKPDESWLLRRVMESEDLRMPPASDSKKGLSADEIAILREWIVQGAEVKPHWAFVPPARPEVPSNSGTKWGRNPIDAFVLAGLREHGLEPVPEADRPTLARRAALALTGLQPDPALLRSFLDDRREDAYERYVDQLLASPRYGEHAARYWLDAVRYGDTHGLHLDNERLVWPYRDWVVRAFNENLPFDKFTVWQLAGDLVPAPTTESRLATGYVRMNPTTNEGGAIVAEVFARNVFDRVDTTSTVFLGMTVGCARCHSHKFDPISQDDYFRLFAYFNSTKDTPMDGNLLTPEPVLPVPSPEQAAALAKARVGQRALVAKVGSAEAEKWAKALESDPPVPGPWEVSQSFPAQNFDSAFAAEFGPEPGGAEDKAEWKAVEIPLGKVKENLGGRENAAVFVRTVLTAKTAGRQSFLLTSDDGVKVWVNGAKVHENKVLRGASGAPDTVTADLKEGKNDLLIEIVNSGGPDGIYVLFEDPLPARAKEAAAEQSKNPESQALTRLYLASGPGSADSLRYRELAAEEAKVDAMVPRSLIAEEGPAVPAYLLRRGEYDQPQHEVKRGLPEFLGTLPPDEPNNRLGLAHWLTSEHNPLTARVFANRVWQQHFGTGIVKTAEDFGNQGEWPSDKELLDWLATEFVDSGWDVKALHRLVVTSAAFRQSAAVSPAALLTDPENRLASRGPAFRLDAEVIRDQALNASGLLNEDMGGKGFKPYQPEGLWEAIGFLESTTAKYTKDTGPGIYRRSLYLFWKRTSPHPTMLTFDAPMREACTVRRSRTNTPMQALLTLNEDGYLESARVLGQLIARSPGTDRERLQRLFEATLCRDAEEDEADRLLGSLARYRTRFLAEPARAAKLLEIGDYSQPAGDNVAESAAWMLLCNTVMNLHEFLNLP
ncbi:MAG: PSD1 and planctomycete cytochrome C domain-containing protein [Fimbriimonadaceae bacterium]